MKPPTPMLEQKRKAALEREAAVHAESHRRLLALRELLKMFERTHMHYRFAWSKRDLKRLEKIRVLAHTPQDGQQHGDRSKKTGRG